MSDLIKIGKRRTPQLDQPRQWRGVEEMEGTLDLEAAENAFSPNGQFDAEAELNLTRRGFMGTAGFTVAAAAATLSGCIRKPEEKIIPYDRRPEDYIPGNPVYFATSAKFGAQVVGLLVESQDGRPTKIEGNPSHPGSLGGTTAQIQASVMGLYDPSKLQAPSNKGSDSTWDAWDAAAGELFASKRSQGGKGVGILLEDTNSPTLQRLLGDWRSAFAQSKLYVHDQSAPVNAVAGTKLVGLEHVSPRLDLRTADIVVALDCDFLGTEGEIVRNSKDFAARRRVDSTADTMNRLYAVEAGLTITGMQADNRLRIKSALIGEFVAEVAKGVIAAGVQAPPGALALVGKLAGHGLDAAATKFAGALAKDLAGHTGHSALLVGERQPALVHGLATLINVAVGNLGKTMSYVPRHDFVPLETDLSVLTADINSGAIDTLLILGGDPVYTGAADTAFGAALGKVGTKIHLTETANDTSAACDWVLAESHYLETWGDHRCGDGTISVQQPLIAPLYESKSAIEVIAALLGGQRDGLSQVQLTWNGRAASAGFDRKWRRWLHEGLIDGTAASGIAPALEAVAALPAEDVDAQGAVVPDETVDAEGADLAAAAPTHAFDWSRLGQALANHSAPDASGTEVNFVLDHGLADGRYGNNGWLLELPDPISKLSWDNAALLSPATARKMGITAQAGIPVPSETEMSVPKMPIRGDGTDMVTITMGGKTLEIVALVTPGIADDVFVVALGWGRGTVGDYGTGAGFNGNAIRTGWFGQADVSKAGKTYEVSSSQYHHVLTPRAGYERRPFVRETSYTSYKAHPTFPDDEELLPKSYLKSLWTEPNKRDGHQWGLSIDLNTCTGCAACVVACQSENNISVVGKERVGYGREMHWIRIDRYFTGDNIDDVQAVVQPVPCMQCETAPCEQVCPVAATSHSPEGLNDMAYNRCIGTRYCANNCPFKVRRFNYFAYSRENDEANEMNEFQRNPDVTVRFRGVIEKCTYCVQRINSETIAAKRDGTRKVADGRIVTACEQACPSDAIVFGDINDSTTAVSKAKSRDHEYVLLSELNIWPRTSYGAKLRNPNPELVTHAPAAAAPAAESHDGGAH
ncbi:MAG: 4Fe-4S dicluster domain-containing protein [Proteobacteria bacterium]|nr:4Fe-4S dicluster domain-containing protein [Pseudomonadota bacterium]